MTYDLTSAVSRLEAARRGEARPARAPTTQSEDTSAGPVLRNAADIAPEETRWLWPGRIPAGMLSIVGGDPGLGKSTLTCAMAAIVSTGGTWPDGGSCEAGGVLWLSAEDDPSRVLVPRLVAHGADLSQIVLLDGVRRVTGGAVDHPSLADDLPQLAAAIERVPKCRLIIIDPISAYLGRVRGNDNGEVRGLLTPIKALAEQSGAGVVLVQHLNKSMSTNATHRMTGSIAFVGAARTGYLVVRDPDDEQRRLFLCAKSNIGPEPSGLGFTIAGDPPRIVFDNKPVHMGAAEALAAAGGVDAEDRSALAEAVDWLQERLSAGGVPAKTVIDDAKSAGIKKRTLDRAKTVLKVKPKRVPGAWVWSLPDDADAREGCQGCQPPEAGNLGNVGNLAPDLPPGW